MSSLLEKLELYTKVLTEKCDVTPDSDLLKSVIKAMGPSIYTGDAEIVAASNKAEAKTFKENFIMKKLGVSDSDAADKAFDSAVEKLGKSNPRKYRAVLAYLIVEELGKQDVFA